jgi:hypothetical protein
MMGLSYAWNDVMKDAFERRALLLHLGDVLNVMDVVLKSGGHDRSVRQLAQANATLAANPLLTQIADDIKPHEFVQRASAAFAGWPAGLLEEELHHERLAATVRDNLFVGNAAGWQGYVAALKPEVSWFGEGLPNEGVSDSAGEAAGGHGAAAPKRSKAVPKHGAAGAEQGTAQSMLGAAASERPEAKTERGAAASEQPEAKLEHGAATSAQRDAKPEHGEATSAQPDAKLEHGAPTSAQADTKPEHGKTTSAQPDAKPEHSATAPAAPAEPRATKEPGDRFYPSWPWKTRE